MEGDSMYSNGISIDPAIMMGKPCIAGTRITVELILEKLAVGQTFERILNSHPRLTHESLQAALDFAAETLRSEDTIYPLRKHFAIKGRPFIIGTNIPVDLVLKKLADAGNYKQVLNEYKNLTHRDIQSALSIALKSFTYKYKPKALEILSEVSC
jgi:uncharacterized protein (DUF433 family)